MHGLSIFNCFLAVTVTYIILSSALKGRAALVGQFIYCWGAAAVLAVVTWQLQRGRAELDAQMDSDDPYTAGIISGHHQELWHLLVGSIALLLIPIISYWYDRRKQRRAALSARTV